MARAPSSIRSDKGRRYTKRASAESTAVSPSWRPRLRSRAADRKLEVARGNRAALDRTSRPAEFLSPQLRRQDRNERLILAEARRGTGATASHQAGGAHRIEYAAVVQRGCVQQVAHVIRLP